MCGRFFEFFNHPLAPKKWKLERAREVERVKTFDSKTNITRRTRSRGQNTRDLIARQHWCQTSTSLDSHSKAFIFGWVLAIFSTAQNSLFNRIFFILASVTACFCVRETTIDVYWIHIDIIDKCVERTEKNTVYTIVK